MVEHDRLHQLKELKMPQLIIFGHKGPHGKKEHDATPDRAALYERTEPLHEIHINEELARITEFSTRILDQATLVRLDDPAELREFVKEDHGFPFDSLCSAFDQPGEQEKQFSLSAHELLHAQA